MKKVVPQLDVTIDVNSQKQAFSGEGRGDVRALVMHETQEPKKGVGAGETIEFFPLTPTQTYAVSSRVVLPVQLPRRLPPPLSTACPI